MYTCDVQYIPRNMHTVFALLCFVVVIHWLIFSYPPGLLRWHCGNLTIAPVPAKQPWWVWMNTSCEFIMNDCITTTKQSTTKPCAYFLGYDVSTSLIQGHVSQFSQAPEKHNCHDVNKKYFRMALCVYNFCQHPDTIMADDIYMPPVHWINAVLGMDSPLDWIQR